MVLKTLLATAGALVVLATTVEAQATLTPSFNAPHRPFVRSEFGGIVSFPDPGGTAYEGVYRLGARRMDLGLRGGILDFEGPAESIMLAGFEGRARVLNHGPAFPLDGAVIFGAGGRFASGQSRFSFPLGLSLGRRVNVDGAALSFVPYVQPTAFLRGGNNMDTGFIYAMGLGADVRFGGAFNARMGIGLGDVEGVSLGAVWVH
jgi:hypothetical protein